MDQKASPDPVDSGFDDPELSDAEFRALTGCEPFREEELPTDSLKPWPLAFAIFGLGMTFFLVGSAVYAMVKFAATH